jgi:hypothetical protein
VTAVLWCLVLLNLGLTVRLLAFARTLGRLGAPAEDRWEPELAVGVPAPTYRARRLDGDRVTEADFAGRPVAYVFLSPNCESCLGTLAKLAPFVPAAAAAGTEVVVVTDTGPKQTATWVADAGGFPGAVLVAPPRVSALIPTYDGPAFFPYFVLVDAAGTVRSRGVVGRPEWVALTAEWAGARV